MMKSFLTTLVAALALCAGAGAAGIAPAPLQVGVADDAAKYADDAGIEFFSRMHEVGLGTDRITIGWDPDRPGTVLEQHFLDGVVAQAGLDGVELVFSVRPVRARAIGASRVRAAQFARYLALLARTYPTIRTFVVGNEPNQPRFWQPQYAGTRAIAARDYERALALSYDALKAVDPEIVVAGGALSSRGNDDPHAVTNSSRSPIRFLADLGRAYRASHRKKPIMDVLAFHPYPRSSRDPLAKGLEWPSAGFPNLGRVKQAVWDAFRGTAQPTVEGGLKLMLSEVGWQVSVSAANESYVGTENVPVAGETHQAAVYGQLLAAAACDASISNVLFLPLVDEKDLAGFQSGLIRADGSERPSYTTVRSWLGRTNGRCKGKRLAWRHVTTVVGARALFRVVARPKTRLQRAWSFAIRSGEDAVYNAVILRATRTPRRTATAASTAKPVLRASGTAKANWTPLVRFPRHALAPGRYVYRVELRADANRDRRRTFVSSTFVVR